MGSKEFQNDVLCLQQSGQIDDLMYNQFEVPGRRDLPPQENWSYKLRHYMQYLVDLQATHHILESGIAEAIAVHQGGESDIVFAIKCQSLLNLSLPNEA